MDRLEGHWLQELADVDARGTAGAEQGQQAPSTASWLRNRLRMGAGAASGSVHTARALFRGPLTATAKALGDGELSAAHASVLVHGTQDLPTTWHWRPSRCWSRRPDGSTRRGCGGSWGICGRSPTPRAPNERASGAMSGGGCGWAPTWEGMVAINGLLEAEAGQTLAAALEPLARPPPPRPGHPQRRPAPRRRPH